MVPSDQGGFSVLVVPSDKDFYEYWLYICPKDSQFSSKQAIKSLRDVYLRGVEPWGGFKNKPLVPLVDQVIKSLLKEEGGELPSSVAEDVLAIIMENSVQANKKLEAESNMKRETAENY